jgi:hypothetical protein
VSSSISVLLTSFCFIIIHLGTYLKYYLLLWGREQEYCDYYFTQYLIFIAANPFLLCF